MSDDFVVWSFIGVLVVCVAFCFYYAFQFDKEQEAKLNECFFQEQKTDECKLFLYKYENRKSTTIYPVYIHH